MLGWFIENNSSFFQNKTVVELEDQVFFFSFLPPFLPLFFPSFLFFSPPFLSFVLLILPPFFLSPLSSLSLSFLFPFFSLSSFFSLLSSLSFLLSFFSLSFLLPPFFSFLLSLAIPSLVASRYAKSVEATDFSEVLFYSFSSFYSFFI